MPESISREKALNEAKLASINAVSLTKFFSGAGNKKQTAQIEYS
jgi:hypothetical protein